MVVQAHGGLSELEGVLLGGGSVEGVCTWEQKDGLL